VFVRFKLKALLVGSVEVRSLLPCRLLIVKFLMQNDTFLAMLS
jgi:hypothetical protein